MSPDSRTTRAPQRDCAKPKRRGAPSAFTDATRGIRLQKVLAEAGVASRRQCEDLIRAGQVRVNGKLVTALPAWVDPEHDKISVDGRPMRPTRRAGRSPRKVYVALNKPRRVITTMHDPQGRRSVADLIDLPDAPRLFPVGRLDADTTGLILLTNDGELAQLLTHPSYEVPKEYHVSIKGRLTDEDVQILKRGLFLARRGPRAPGGQFPPGPVGGSKADGRAPARRAAMQQVKRLGYSRGKTGNERTRLSVLLTEGQNREIRRLLARLGFTVRRLERVAIGPLRLKGLGPGQWRLLDAREVNMLRKAGTVPAARDDRARKHRPPSSGRHRRKVKTG